MKTPKILFLSPVPLSPADDGVKIRGSSLLAAFQLLGHVQILHFASNEGSVGIPLPRKPGALQRIFSPYPSLLKCFKSDEFARKVKDARTEIDICVCLGLQMFQYAECLEVRTRVILDNFNVESDILLGLSHNRQSLKKAYWRFQYAKLLFYEKNALRRATEVFAISDKDGQKFKKLVPSAAVRVVPPGLKFNEKELDRALGTRDTIVFVGVLDWHVNVEAVKWMCNHVFPRVRQACPSAKFQIVGRRPTPEVMALASIEGVTVHADVPEVGVYLTEASAVVVPLLFGSGVKTKVIEALSVGKAVVTTSIGLEGINVQPGRDLLLADNAQDFATQCVKLLKSPDLAAELGRSGRKLVLREYSWERQCQRVRNAVEKLTLNANVPDTTRITFVVPTLRGYGGAEKYMVDAISAAASRFPVSIISSHQVDLAEVARAFNVRLDSSSIEFRVDARCLPQSGGLLQTLLSEYRYRSMTRGLEVVITHDWLLPWPSAARKSILVCHFPVVSERLRLQGKKAGKLLKLFTSAGRNDFRIRRRVNSWREVITSSEFARFWIRKYWQREATVVYPGIDRGVPGPVPRKNKWILACGFFSNPNFNGGEKHSYKRQDFLIEIFNQLSVGPLRDWELHLAGHVSQDKEGEKTLQRLRSMATGSVVLHPNCDFQELESLYSHSRIFWHATGFGLDANLKPERMEHFGMVTVEAMSRGCIPIVYGEGGQREIVSADCGFLWSTPAQLIEATTKVSQDSSDEMASAAVRRAARFNLEAFRSAFLERLDVALQTDETMHY